MKLRMRKAGLGVVAEFFGGDAHQRLLQKPAPVALPLPVIQRGPHDALLQARRGERSS